jgi:glycosyltransferase involved in cell wall biosynthesis
VSYAHVACVIPALNAAPTRPGVIAGLRQSLPGSHIAVIDDGSMDGTHTVAEPIVDETIRFTRNRGKGAALRAGFRAALDRGSDVVLTIDADGQHEPVFAPALVDALRTADLAIGARDRRSVDMPAGRRLTNRMSAAAVSRSIGRTVDDAQSGYSAVRAAVLPFISPRGDRYEFETEFLILAGRRGYHIAYVPISTRYPAIVPSQFRPVRDSARIIGALWRFSVGAER